MKVVFFNTLGQSRTANFDNTLQSLIITGVGTDLIDNPSLLKRANKKVITNALVMALVDISKESGELDWTKRYWNSYHCQTKLIGYKNKFYTKLCRNRWCATCYGIRKAELLNKYYDELLKWEEPHLLTLTLKSVGANQLDERINDMVKAFVRIKDRCNKRRKRSNAMKIMGLKSLECNYNANRRWYNPHFHIITPNRQIALYIKQEWKNEWNKYSYLASENAQDIRIIENIESGLIEVIKYGAKMLSEPDPNKKRKRQKGNLNGLSIYANGLHTIYKAFDNHQLFKSFGFSLPNQELKTTSTQLIFNYDVWKYRINDMDWVNTSTGKYLTDYELDANLDYILKTSIDKVLN